MAPNVECCHPVVAREYGLIRGFRLERDVAPAGASAVGIPSAVSNIQLWYRLNGKLVLEPPASGFVIDVWPQHLITARHAVMPRDGGTHVAVDVTFGEPGDRMEVPAVSVAYSKDEDLANDLAVICLARAMAGPLLPVATELPDDKTETDAEIVGRPHERLVRIETRVVCDKAWLLYLAAGGLAGT